MTLYEISNDYINFITAVENGEIPEEAIQDTLDSIEGEFNEKIESIACLIKNINAEAEAIKLEADNLKQRADAKIRHSERLKEYLLSALEATDKKKVETTRAVVSWRPTESVLIENDEQFCEMYPCLAKETVSIKPIKSEVKKAIKAGQTLDGAVIVVSKSLSVR